ncbi:hypothetical protein AU255_09585 [Methyloprofundus sedimenti]|uniref:VWFA domain-containing protein n=1 Tax=Methyloprofundus sedimenti TaxID=1420851 RepID=A0A1V8M977_9GAMM|nr:IPTL-CTERM sorting domain-containing protein [Methyloprofundus sedimenti]OQK18077.1 hypothetical protein AU255_09585 [Methyloprofundus sedimenti]
MSNHFKILFLFLTFFFTSQTQAVELCLSLDGSSSIIPADFQLQLEGVAASVENSSIIPQDSSVYISVVQFSDNATVEVGSTLIADQDTADILAAKIRNIKQVKGGTNIGAGITSCTSTFVTNDKQIIDVSTDGVSQVNPIPARQAAVLAGVDVVNAIGVGTGINEAQLSALVWPQPETPIPGPGFVVLVASFQEYTAAIEAKIKAEVKPDPEPGPGPEPGPDPQPNPSPNPEPSPSPSNGTQPIPTLNEWGLILLSLLMLTVTMRNKKFRNT